MNQRTKNLIWVMLATMVIAFYWDSLPFFKPLTHAALDPSAGELFNRNINLGMIVFAGSISLIISLFQRFTVDQETLRQFKKEQKILGEEMQKYKDDPEKFLELQKKSLEFIPKTLDITMRPVVYTALPIVLFFRWFADYFDALAEPLKIFGIFSTNGFFIFPSWLWPYIITSIFFSMIFRKLFKLA